MRWHCLPNETMVVMWWPQGKPTAGVVITQEAPAALTDFQQQLGSGCWAQGACR